AWLLSEQSPPDGVALGPEVLALVVEAVALPIHDNAERDRVHASDNSSVELRRTAVHRDGVALSRVADLFGPAIQQHPQHSAGVVGGASDDEVLRYLAPALLEPGEVGLETAGRGYDGARPHRLRGASPRHQRGRKLAAADLQLLHLGIVCNAGAEALHRAVIGVHQRL